VFEPPSNRQVGERIVNRALAVLLFGADWLLVRADLLDGSSRWRNNNLGFSVCQCQGVQRGWRSTRADGIGGSRLTDRAAPPGVARLAAKPRAGDQPVPREGN
jgi:hypothetical protein